MPVTEKRGSGIWARMVEVWSTEEVRSVFEDMDKTEKMWIYKFHEIEKIEYDGRSKKIVEKLVNKMLVRKFALTKELTLTELGYAILRILEDPNDIRSTDW